MTRFIYIKNRKYNLYESYETWEQAHKEAKHHKRKNKSKYFIMKVEQGWWFPETKYRLYLDKVIRLW